MIFIDPDKCNEKELEYIMEHEYYHVRLGHSVDRLMAELILAIAWINPVAWMLRKAIVVNHEYQADKGVVEHGTDEFNYQLTILNQYIGSASLTNQFSSHIKNRIKMLNKKYKKGSFWKGMILFPVSIALLFFMACGNEGGMAEDPADSNAEVKAGSEEEMIFFVVEDMPEWPGEDDMITALRKFIAVNLKYPDEAIKNGVEGKVFVHFMVTKEGKVIVPDPSILPPEKDEEGNIDEVVVVSYRPEEGADANADEEVIELLKAEAVRVIELIPDLVPGKQRGQNVNVMFTMPIQFKLD